MEGNFNSKFVNPLRAEGTSVFLDIQYPHEPVIVRPECNPGGVFVDEETETQ